MKNIKDLIEKITSRIEAIPLAENYGNDVLIQIGVDIVKFGSAVSLIFKKEYVKGLVEIAAIADGYDDFDATFQVAAKQLADLDPVELAGLVAAIKEQYNPKDDRLELRVERVLDLFPAIYTRFSSSKNLIKEIQTVIDHDANGFRWKSENLSEKAGDVTSELWQWYDTLTEAGEALGGLFKKENQDVA